MKRIVFVFCILLLNLISAVYAEDRIYSCTSDPADFNGKVFNDLIIGTGSCDGNTAMLKNITVTGDVHLTGGSVFFAGSDLNRVRLDCPAGSHCEIGLDGETELKELELFPGVGSSVMVSGLMQTDEPLPSFYGKGYLCEGQPEFAAYADVEISIDYQLQDLETFDILGKIDSVRISAADDTAVTFNNVWLHRAFIQADDSRSPRNFTVNTAGFAFIDLLDSGISFGLHNMDPQHLPHNHGRRCSYVAGDQMNIGLLLLHSDADLTVSMDRQYIDYVVFFGSGCDHSTLTLNAYAGSAQVSDIYQVHVYDANAEFYNKTIQDVYFLIAPDEVPYECFYQFFDRAEDLLRNRQRDFTDPEMLPFLPDADSAYWDRIDAAFVWSQLMPYYNITPAGPAQNGAGHVYASQEVNVPYIYYHAAYIDKVRVLNAYGSIDGQLPDYIKQKNWASPNPFMTGSTMRLCENGGCGFNHSMSLGTVSFETSLRDLP
ncbi:MAG: hypothetical protein IJI57_00085 [Flexilinea sp.]|nr:hypothetical protein [Flexilinea sp.]